jgi:hypothetical protein
MSTPVICASADFFPRASAIKNQDKMRLPGVPAAPVLVFHSSFHKTASPNGKRTFLVRCVNEPKDTLDGTTRCASLCLLRKQIT